MGFADGFASGVQGARGIVSSYFDTKDGIYKNAVQADNLDQIAQAKQERDYQEGLRQAIAAGAAGTPTAAPAEAPAPAPSFTDLTNAGQIANPYDAPPAPINTATPMADSMGDAAASMRSTDNPGMVDGTAPTSMIAPDSRPLWQKQADGYKAGTDFALKNGRLEHAAELIHAGVSARTQAGGEAMKTGLQSFMTTGDTSGLVDAFNIYGDGITAKSFTQQPDGTYTLTLDNQGKPQQMAGITKDQVPGLVAQYADPAAAYQRQVQVQADRAKATFTTNEDIRKENSKANAERVGRAPTITMQKNADGSETPIVVQPTTTGYAIGNMNGDAPRAPALSQNDVGMHKDITSAAYQGLESTMQMMQPEDKAKVESRAYRAQSLYDSNKDNPNIGAMNPMHWLQLADAEKNGTAKPVVMEDANGVKKPGLVMNNVVYATDSIPYNSGANATRPANVPAVLPNGSPFTRGTVRAPVVPPAAAPSASAAAFNADPTVARVAAPAAAAARETDRVKVLNDELNDKSVALATATDPVTKQRLQGDVAAVSSELAKVRGAVPPIAAARVPVNVPIAQAPPAVLPPPTVTAARAPIPAAPSPAMKTPPAASQASDKGATQIPALSLEQAAKANARLAQVNASLAMQARGVVDGSRSELDPTLVQERDSLKAQLDQTSKKSDEDARAARNAAVRGQQRAIGGGLMSLR